MSDLILYCIMHSQTIAGLLFAFLIGTIYGAWLQFKNEDTKKAAEHWNA